MSVTHSLVSLAAGAAVLGKAGISLMATKAFAFSAVMFAPTRYPRNWAAFRQLEDMSDGDLRDIGLTRGDLRDVRGMGLSSDPTLELVRIRDERCR